MGASADDSLYADDLIREILENIFFLECAQIQNRKGKGTRARIWFGNDI